MQTWPEQVALASRDADQACADPEPHRPADARHGAGDLFSSSGIEALRVGLDRAYEARDKRPWWLARLLSIGFVLVGAVALLALGFLIVLAPLFWSSIVHFAPVMHAFDKRATYARFAIAAIVIVTALIIVHKYLPAGRRTLSTSRRASL